MGTFSVESDTLHVDDGIIVLITRSKCFLVISEMSLLLVGSLSSSYFCCLEMCVLSTCVVGCIQSVCLFVCARDALLLEAIGCALTKFAYNLHTEV